MSRKCKIKNRKSTENVFLISFSKQKNGIYGLIPLGRSRLGIPTKEIITYRAIIRFEKTPPCHFF